MPTSVAVRNFAHQFAKIANHRAVEDDPVSEKLFIGPQLRRMRNERGLTQADLARLLEISPSYLNQIEHDQRPLSVPVLLRLGAVLDFDIRSLSDHEQAGLIADVQAALADPTSGVRADLGAQHRRAADAARRVEEIAAGLGDRLPEGAGISSAPYDEVLDFVYDHGNYFDRLDRAAEDVADAAGATGMDVATHLEALLADRHGVSVATADMRDRRSYDPDARRVVLAAGLTPRQRAFQLAAQWAQIAHHRELVRLTEVPGLSSEESRALARIGLANYFAGAVLLPYGRFLAAAERHRYDIELLADRFGVSLETICHRLSTLQRAGAAGVPFVFVRVDRAGNVSKRHSATDFHFSRIGGNCPLWNIYEAFTAPDRVITQVAQLPDGRTYLWVACATVHRIGGYGTPRTRFALGLGCDIRHADKLVYAGGRVLDDPTAVVPIGPGCKLCERTDCLQRAFPLIGRPLDIDETRVRAEPYPAR